MPANSQQGIHAPAALKSPMVIDTNTTIYTKLPEGVQELCTEIVFHFSAFHTRGFIYNVKQFSVIFVCVPKLVQG